MAVEEQGSPGTTFLVAPTADTDMMDKLGLGGAALAGDRLFAGAMAINLKTLARLKEAKTVADETRICLDSVKATLERGGGTLSDIAKMTCYASDQEHIPEMWRTLNDIFAPGPCPKRITLVAGIAGDCRVEFEILAVVPQEDGR
ncbi:RidA family protein [Streptomyces sp. NPDC048425]|uniref:RidA family protein n=1 Tax=Streptomyces sp. NPDC048425 TaxID=3365548 RepID=UPI0037204332